MGYMGFGMRKEVYTRKPKRSFEKIKELYGNDIPRVEETDGKYELKAEDILNKQRFRTLYDTKAFRYFLVIAVLAGLSLTAYNLFIHPIILKYKKKAFEKEIMAGRGKYQFLIHARKDLSGLEYLFIGPENEIKMNLVNRVTPDSAFEYSQKVFLAPRRYNARSFVIEGERLKVDRRDSIQVLDGHWMILYESDSIDASGLAILEYAHVEPEYVENLRSKMKELNLAKVSYHGAEVSFPFAEHPDFGSYDLISHPADKRGLIKVDSVTYLKRTPVTGYRRYF